MWVKKMCGRTKAVMLSAMIAAQKFTVIKREICDVLCKTGVHKCVVCGVKQAAKSIIRTRLISLYVLGKKKETKLSLSELHEMRCMYREEKKEKNRKKFSASRTAHSCGVYDDRGLKKSPGAIFDTPTYLLNEEWMLITSTLYLVSIKKQFSKTF